MLDNIKLGQYLHGESWYYRLDPRNKLVISTLFIILIFLANNWQTYSIVSIFTLIIVLTSGVSLKFFYKSIRPIFFLMLFTFVLNLMFIRTGDILMTFPIIRVYDLTYLAQLSSFILFGMIVLLLIGLSLKKILPSGIPWRIFKYSLILFIFFNIVVMVYFKNEPGIRWEVLFPLYQGALINGSFIILRLLLIISFSSLLTFTTKPTDLTLAIERVLGPLKVIKVPVSELALMISISLRFIPTLLEETQKILKAQTSRGADFSEGNVKDKIIQIISLLVPMFIISFKRAEDLANAMEARGYVPGKMRTSYRELRWHYRDTLFIIAFVIMISLLIIFRYGLFQ
jgi:energy-coupling factor transport system permease protein